MSPSDEIYMQSTPFDPFDSVTYAKDLGSNHDPKDQDVPQAEYFLNWGSLLGWLDFNWSISAYIMNITWGEANFFSRVGMVQSGIGAVTNSDRLREAGKENQKFAGVILLGGAVAALSYLVVSTVVVTIYWAITEGLFHSAFKATVAAGKAIGQSITACAAWIKNSCVNFTANMRNKLFAKQPIATTGFKFENDESAHVAQPIQLDHNSPVLNFAKVVPPPSIGEVVSPPDLTVAQADKLGVAQYLRMQ